MGRPRSSRRTLSKRVVPTIGSGEEREEGTPSVARRTREAPWPPDVLRSERGRGKGRGPRRSDVKPLPPSWGLGLVEASRDQTGEMLGLSLGAPKGPLNDMRPKTGDLGVDRVVEDLQSFYVFESLSPRQVSHFWHPRRGPFVRESIWVAKLVLRVPKSLRRRVYPEVALLPGEDPGEPLRWVYCDRGRRETRPSGSSPLRDLGLSRRRGAGTSG